MTHKCDFCDFVHDRDIKYSSVFTHSLHTVLFITAVVSVESARIQHN